MTTISVKEPRLGDRNEEKDMRAADRFARCGDGDAGTQYRSSSLEDLPTVVAVARDWSH